MRWIASMKINGTPTYYEAYQLDAHIFSIERVGGLAIYLTDLRSKPYKNYCFDTIENAKMAAKQAYYGQDIVGNKEDPSIKLSKIIEDAEEFLKQVKKWK